jgi:hypothetical protein
MSSKKHSLVDGTIAAMNPFIPDPRGDLPSIQMEKKSIHLNPYKRNTHFKKLKLKTVDYVKVALVLAPQFISGCLLYLLLLKRPEVGLVELLSIGSVLGIISSTIADQIFVNLQLPKIGWLVSILVIVIAFVICQLRNTIVFATILWQRELTRSLLPIAAIATMAIGTEFFWLFPSGVLFVLAAFVSMIRTHRLSNTAIRLLIVSAVVAGALMIINRPDVWWFLEEGDFPYLQALSHSLAERGISDGFLVSGTAIKYHWFTYAWIGLVERASNAAVFLVLTKVAPSVVVFLITGLSWFMNCFTNKGITAA